MTASTADAVVIGSGINGLVSAAELAGAGWRVCLLEANEELGGFVSSGELTLPGYVHDTFSSWHPLFVTGGAYENLGADLARHGLEYCNSDELVTASVGADGQRVVAYRDPQVTAGQFAAPGDGARYLSMLDRLGTNLPAIGGLLGAELRGRDALGPLWRLARRNRLTGLERWARDTVASGRAFCRREFAGAEVDQLWSPWLLHAGLAPDNASGGLMIPLLAGTIHAAGLPIVRGGAGNFVQAFRRLLDERGVEVRTGAPAERILLRHGRAVGVQLSGGERITAARAVIASVSPAALYGQLLPPGAVSLEIRDEAQRYRSGRAAMQVHIALDRPLDWTDTVLAGVPLIHLSDGSASTAIACAEAEAGLLPRRPTVVVGQQHVLDPSRVPQGAAALWLQLQELPFHPTGDAAEELDTSGGWSRGLAAAYVDRVLGLLDRHAPGARTRVREVRACTPSDLLAANRNAEHGDPYGGSAELDQNLLWRPGPASSRHRTAVDHLWHIGAATHPGPGLGAGSGHLVAQQLIRRTGRRGATDQRSGRGGAAR